MRHVSKIHSDGTGRSRLHVDQKPATEGKMREESEQGTVNSEQLADGFETFVPPPCGESREEFERDRLGQTGEDNAAKLNITRAKAATEFIPEGEPIPYDAGKAGLLFDAPQSVAEIIATGGTDGLFEAIRIEESVELPPIPFISVVGEPDDLTIPTEINGLAIHHGKILTKEEIKRILDGYRNELEVFGSPYDETLKQLEALGEANWTAAEVEQAADIVRYYQKHRIATETHRKTLKEKSLRTGQFIDGAANIVKAHCENREERGKAIVQYEARKAALERALLTEARELALAPFVESVKTYDVGGMSEEAFAAVLAGAKATYISGEGARLEAQRVAAVEAQKREAEERAVAVTFRRVSDLSKLGMTLRADGSGVYEFANLFGVSVIVSQATIEEATDNEWMNMLAANEAEITHLRTRQADAYREAQAAKAEIARKAEEERRLAAAPDRERLFAWLDAVDAIAIPPELNDALLHARAMTAAGEIQAIAQRVRERTNAEESYI